MAELLLKKKNRTNKSESSSLGASTNDRDSDDLRQQRLLRIAQREQQVKMVNKFVEEAYEQLEGLRDLKAKAIPEQIRSIVEKLPPQARKQLLENEKIKDLQAELERGLHDLQHKTRPIRGKQKSGSRKMRRHLI